MTFTFANTYTGGTILSGGATLAVGNDAALGGVNSGVTFNNGTLQFLSSFNLANTRALTLNAGGENDRHQRQRHDDLAGDRRCGVA